MRTPRWFRRLFAQHRAEPVGVTGESLGFTGAAGKVIIDDEYQAEKIAVADDPRHRLYATYGYLLKVTKHSRLAAEDTNDPDLADRIDEAMDDVSEFMLCTIDDIKTRLREEPSQSLIT